MTHFPDTNDQNTILQYTYTGALPFFALSITPWISPDSKYIAIDLFLLYSTLILNFLAGTFWVLGITKHGEKPRYHLHAAIFLSLWGFLSHLLPYKPQIVCLAIGLLEKLWREKRFFSAFYTDWYQQLRHRITYIVLGCHLFAFWGISQI